MHLDLNLGGPARLTGDVAIIGAGAAGISMARRLRSHGLSVLLLESGGLDHEAETMALNEGAVVGMDYYPLDQARLRFFGGTTAIWGGRIARLDPIDFQRRSWVPHSGWPFPAAELERHYTEAMAVFGLPATQPGIDAVRAAGAPLPAFDEEVLRTPLWSFDPQFDRFSFARSADLARDAGCTIVTHATVREIVAAANGGSIDRLDVVATGGRTLAVHAKHYVLAAGGIENPRLLLASRSVMADGLGNDHDQVGRYFMEHPHARGGAIVGGRPWAMLAAFARRQGDGRDIAPLIAPAPDLQPRLGLLNTSLTIAPRRPADGRESWAMQAYLRAKHGTAPNRLGRTLWKHTKRSVGWLQKRTDPARPWLLNRLGRLDIALVGRAEQAPNPDSRVTLSRDRDATGVPRAVLDWRTSALDVDSVAGLVDALAHETARLGLGQVEKAAWLSDPAKAWATDPLISAHPIGGYHHMGTTRMADDPRRGVTDRHGTVHGFANLHVAGSSLFPTSGWANPTLTVVALALRTADRIARDAGGRSAASVREPAGRGVTAALA